MWLCSCFHEEMDAVCPPDDLRLSLRLALAYSSREACQPGLQGPWVLLRAPLRPLLPPCEEAHASLLEDEGQQTRAHQPRPQKPETAQLRSANPSHTWLATDGRPMMEPSGHQNCPAELSLTLWPAHELYRKLFQANKWLIKHQLFAGRAYNTFIRWKISLFKKTM